MEVAPRLPASACLIDLSGDFRLRGRGQFRAALWGASTAPWTHRHSLFYGLTETNREVIRTARRVRNPDALLRLPCSAWAPLVAKTMF